LTILSFRLRFSSVQNCLAILPFTGRFKHSLHAATSKSCTQLVFPVCPSQPVSRSRDFTKTSLSFTYPFPVRDFLKAFASFENLRPVKELGVLRASRSGLLENCKAILHK
jgi:hypothetical protein